MVLDPHAGFSRSRVGGLTGNEVMECWSIAVMLNGRASGTPQGAAVSSPPTNGLFCGWGAAHLLQENASDAFPGVEIAVSRRTGDHSITPPWRWQSEHYSFCKVSRPRSFVSGSSFSMFGMARPLLIYCRASSFRPIWA